MLQRLPLPAAMSVPPAAFTPDCHLGIDPRHRCLPIEIVPRSFPTNAFLLGPSIVGLGERALWRSRRRLYPGSCGEVTLNRLPLLLELTPEGQDLSGLTLHLEVSIGINQLMPCE